MSDKAVDNEIDWRIEDHEKVGEEDQDLHLMGRPPGKGATSHYLVHTGELIDV